MEFFLDIYSDEAIALTEIQKEFQDIDIEYASGLSGLEIAGTLIIPATALLFQVITFTKELKKEKHQSIIIKRIVIQKGDETVVVDGDADDNRIMEIIKSIQ